MSRIGNYARKGAVGQPIRFKFTAAVYASLSAVSIKVKQQDSSTATEKTLSAVAEPATYSYVGYTGSGDLADAGTYAARILFTSGAYTGPGDQVIVFEVLDDYDEAL